MSISEYANYKNVCEKTGILWFLLFSYGFVAQNGEVVRNESVFIGNETVYENVTVFGSSLADNPDFDVYRSIYAVTVIAILATNLIRGFVFANVCTVSALLA